MELEEELGTAMEAEKAAVSVAAPFWLTAYTECHMWPVLNCSHRLPCMARA